MENIQLDPLQTKLLDDIIAGETKVPILAEKYAVSEAVIKGKIHSMDTGIRAKLTAYFEKKRLEGLLTGVQEETVSVPKHLSEWSTFLRTHGLFVESKRE